MNSLLLLLFSLVSIFANGGTLSILEHRDIIHRDSKTLGELTQSSHQTKTGTKKDVCSNNPCLNGGICIIDHNYIDGFRCKCTSDYEGIRCKELHCKVSLLKDTSLKCVLKRALDIRKRKKLFALVSESNVVDRSSRIEKLDIPLMVVHSYKGFIKEASTSPFTIDWYMKMQETINSNSEAQDHFTLIDKNFPKQPTLKDFSAIYEYFYRLHRTKSAMSVIRQSPSIEANFFKDREFVDQRFAGANVWQVYRVTKLKELDWNENTIIPSPPKEIIKKKLARNYNQAVYTSQTSSCSVFPLGKKADDFTCLGEAPDGHGLNWENLEGKLNGHFDWNNALNEILKTNDERALNKAIEENRLFVSWYPELEGVVLDRDQLIDNHISNRTLVRLTAPITMFVMKENGVSEDLEVVAIQADSISEARVFTPSDGKGWFFAKLLVQRADLNVLQVVHKRLKSDLYMEPFCLLMERSFSEFHPIYNMLQYHCRATLETNKLYDMKFYGPDGPLYSLLSIGHQTSIQIINKNYHKITFDNIDLESDLMKRGLEDDNILPYFPYRDDARLIVKCVKSFANRYVDLYYHHDTEVRSDHELQQWVNLLSIDGNKTALSRGLVKNFPKNLINRQELKTVLWKLLWLATGFHASVTFPQLEYASFLPNAPYRIFVDDENNAVFSNTMFGSKEKALDQAKFSSNIASTHLDKLFDYGHKLHDKEAKKLVDDIVAKDLVEITGKMAFANAMRVKSGHLPYPYLLPDFVTNSVST